PQLAPGWAFARVVTRPAVEVLVTAGADAKQVGEVFLEDVPVGEVVGVFDGVGVASLAYASGPVPDVFSELLPGGGLQVCVVAVFVVHADMYSACQGFWVFISFGVLRNVLIL